ncbi:UvrD-helicase domain-containing protein [Pseudoxanthomonas dokdonensis]|uniref:DNA 3'-5' helicase n=1 Tax=Pseudoxanthomonas dokdonensis TaxID=344882 RepID=A0A0R0CXN2_9GAMM|nr:UvrD-helicase domain-containing protein [Pseudoxanthomonas dokdonensis]KRG70548.1 DNA helicase UvrD [Pseudoxanthomonas dokdonensis]
MTPFRRARLAAQQLRRQHCPEAAADGLRSFDLIARIAAAEAEDFDISATRPDDAALCGADAVLVRDFRQILVRNDVEPPDRAFLVAHEFGHWILHPEEHEGCRQVIASTLNPAEDDTLGAKRVEAYGARERAELQANVFARELLLPRTLARALFLGGRTASRIAADLALPLELVRQQLLDALLLPEDGLADDAPQPALTPTDEQLDAARSSARTSLVVAGPGTGKTATLLMRMEHLLANGAKPAELLVLTFSNRAARELVDRLAATGVPDAHEMWVGTFHAFGLEFLRKNHERFGLRPGFGVADKMAQIALLEPHIYGLPLRVFNPLGDPLPWLDQAVKTMQRAKDELLDADAFTRIVEAGAARADADRLALDRDLALLYRTYEALLRGNSGLVDFGDLILLPAQALRANRAEFAPSIGRFRHVLVDEYQDVNRASAELVKAMAAQADCLWVVGDPRQAIYRFRGASIRNIVRFADDFPQHREFRLNENWRSFEEIVRVVEHTGRDDNPLQGVLPLGGVAPVRGQGGVRPTLVSCENESIAYGELVSRVRRLQAEGTAFREQVILANRHDTCDAAAAALVALGIPVLHLGDIFQRPEVKDLLALLQLFVDRSGSPLVRIAQLPGLALPAPDVDVLIDHLRDTRPAPFSWLHAPPATLSPDGAQALHRWRDTFGGLSSHDSPWDVICSLLFERTRWLADYANGSDMQAVTRRLALWQIIYYLRVPDGGRAYQTVGTFLTRLRRRLRLADDRDLRIPPPEADLLDAVAVMTIHQSKGLEFEAVHLMDVDARHFERSDDATWLPEVLTQSAGGVDEARSEAANRLYVALSRARSSLTLYEEKSYFKAARAPAVQRAAHLLNCVVGTVAYAVGHHAAAPPTLAPQVPVDLREFVTYRTCPRRYYYDVMRQLSPAAGLHPAARIEAAVMRELFAPAGGDVSAPANDVAVELAMLAEEYEPARLHLSAYAMQLLDAGRAWSGVSRAAMASPIDVVCDGLPVRVIAHRVTRQDNVVTLHFVRAQPSSPYAKQHKILRWVLKCLNQQYRQYRFQGSLYVLSSRVSEHVYPYQDRGFDHLVEMGRELMEGRFPAKPNSWACAGCRHFLYCPA